MQTEIVKITKENKKEVIEKSAKIIKSGGLVVFPTETVYGLGANALDEEALKKIFLAKGRPSDNPLIVHISDFTQLSQLTNEVSPLEQKLVESFWPGPLTIIFQKKENISNVVSGGLSSIAVRMPLHPIAQELITGAGVPIAAPSANTSGRPSGTDGQDVFKDLEGKVEMIIDAGPSDIGVESTVVRVEGNSISILRPGAVTKEMLSAIAPVEQEVNANRLHLSPGTKYKHYSPEGKLEIISKTDDMQARAEVLIKEGKSVGIICVNQNESIFEKYKPNVFSLGDRDNLEEISKNLYKALRFFDTHQVDVIICQTFTPLGLGVAIMDRLTRASDEHN